MATFFVDGDKGGVGKSFMARALADYLLTTGHCRKLVVVDCDPSNPDVVGDNAYASETTESGIEIVAERKPVKNADDWPAVIDFALQHVTGGEKVDCVFSLPAGAGLYIDHTTIEMQALLQPALTVWVMGTDKSSVDQLEARLNKSTSFYAYGIVALNTYHGQPDKGAFWQWNESNVRTMVEHSWPEITIPRVMPFGVESIGTQPFHVVLRNKRISPILPVIINGFRRELHSQLDAAFQKLEV
jgi:hypothetical protein